MSQPPYPPPAPQGPGQPQYPPPPRQPYGHAPAGVTGGQYTGQQPPAPQVPPRRRRRWPWIIGGVVLALVVVSALNAGQGTPSPARSTSTPTVAATPSTALALPAAPASPAPAPVPAPAGPLTTFGNGTYLVGEDVTPGKYRSPGVQDSIAPLCYWDLTDESGTIKDQGIANEGPSRATLREGLTFKSQGCEDWVIQNS